MNKQRRKEIDKVKEDIRYLIEKIKMVKKVLENINDDEQEYLDNMPENLQSSRKADDAQDAIDNMEDAIDSMNDVIDSLESIF